MRRNLRKARKLRKKPKKAIWGLLLALLILLGLAFMLDKQLRPAIETIAAYQAKVHATQAINNAVLQELSRAAPSYDSLVTLNRDENGNIVAIETNSLAISQIKSNVSNAVLKSLTDLDTDEVSIPIGTLSGVQWFSGMGPSITLKVLPVGVVTCEIQNVFDSSGINQTRHQLMLKVTANISAIIPGYTVTTSTVSSFIIAETILVGQVPEGFLQFSGGSTPYLSKINAYSPENPVLSDGVLW